MTRHKTRCERCGAVAVTVAPLRIGRLISRPTRLCWLCADLRRYRFFRLVRAVA